MTTRPPGSAASRHMAVTLPVHEAGGRRVGWAVWYGGCNVIFKGGLLARWRARAAARRINDRDGW